jgi:hypothetical protein
VELITLFLIFKNKFIIKLLTLKTLITKFTLKMQYKWKSKPYGELAKLLHSLESIIIPETEAATHRPAAERRLGGQNLFSQLDVQQLG